MRKKGEHVKGHWRSQSARKQVGRGHTASVQAAASKGFRSEWEKAVPEFLQEGRSPSLSGAAYQQCNRTPFPRAGIIPVLSTV